MNSVSNVFGLLLLAGILVSTALWTIWPFIVAFVFVYVLAAMMKKGRHGRRRRQE